MPKGDFLPLLRGERPRKILIVHCRGSQGRRRPSTTCARSGLARGRGTHWQTPPRGAWRLPKDQTFASAHPLRRDAKSDGLWTGTKEENVSDQSSIKTSEQPFRPSAGEGTWKKDGKAVTTGAVWRVCERSGRMISSRLARVCEGGTGLLTESLVMLLSHLVKLLPREHAVVVPVDHSELGHLQPASGDDEWTWGHSAPCKGIPALFQIQAGAGDGKDFTFSCGEGESLTPVMNCSFSQSVSWAMTFPTSITATAANTRLEALILQPRGISISAFQLTAIQYSGMTSALHQISLLKIA